MSPTSILPAPMTFADAADPDRADRQLPAVPGRVPTPAVRTKLLTMLLRKGEPKAAGKFPAAEIARNADVSEANLSWYINWQPGKDLPFAGLDAFERALEQWMLSMDSVSEAKAAGFEPFETAVSQRVIAECKSARANGHVIVIHGDAGIGKSQSMPLLQSEMPRALVIPASTWSGGANQLAAVMFTRLGLHESRKGGSKMTRVAKALRDNPRLVVIDNAQRLQSGALKFLFDLYDQNAAPERRVCFALVGNPEIVDNLRANDQFFSRLSIVVNLNDVLHTAGSDSKAAAQRRAEIKTICRRLVTRYVPGHESDLTGPASKLAEITGNGRFRSVEKRLAMVKRLLTSPDFADKPLEAWKAADSLLITRFPNSTED